MTHEELFKQLLATNVNENTEKKNGLTYLSWTYAIAEFEKACSGFEYKVRWFKDKDGVEKPYTYDENAGYMVFTEITANGVTREMWLPVMDGANKAMLDHAYTYKTKYEEKSVEPATMFDINKTIMRCLVKNMAMFGLGLYIYAGEDLPIDTETCTSDQISRMKELGVKEDGIKAKFKVKSIEDLTRSQADFVIKAKEQAK